MAHTPGGPDGPACCNARGAPSASASLAIKASVGLSSMRYKYSLLIPGRSASITFVIFRFSKNDQCSFFMIFFFPKAKYELVIYKFHSTSLHKNPSYAHPALRKPRGRSIGRPHRPAGLQPTLPQTKSRPTGRLPHSTGRKISVFSFSGGTLPGRLRYFSKHGASRSVHPLRGSHSPHMRR